MFQNATEAAAPRSSITTAARSHPFVTLRAALTLLRIGTATLFMLHALVRVITPGSIPQFGRFLSQSGLPQGAVVVWALTVFELGAGLLIILNVRTRILASGFATILIVGIALIHRRLGWFVGGHGTGGSEYSVALLLALLVIAAADADGAVRSRALPAPLRDTSGHS